MRRIPVVILGIGGVGRQLIQHIVDTRRLHAKQGLHIGVVGICDSRSLLLVNDAMVSGMSDECLLEICKLKASAAFLPMLSSKFGNFEVFGAAEIPGKLMATAGDLGRITGLAFVDCSASSETVGLLNQVIELGCCVVLANKKPLTSDMEVYDKLVSHPRRIRYESTIQKEMEKADVGYNEPWEAEEEEEEEAYENVDDDEDDSSLRTDLESSRARKHTSQFDPISLENFDDLEPWIEEEPATIFDEGEFVVVNILVRIFKFLTMKMKKKMEMMKTMSHRYGYGCRYSKVWNISDDH
ncbi:hypothetical protein EJ110_NYTH17248 [Nymphaea thermarum]|nr:hypothetical protein EJ110_NYTH17248 [Nymphaea thermarum]